MTQLISQYNFFVGEMKVDKLVHLPIHFGGKKNAISFYGKNQQPCLGFLLIKNSLKAFLTTAQARRTGKKKAHHAFLTLTKRKPKNALFVFTALIPMCF